MTLFLSTVRGGLLPLWPFQVPTGEMRGTRGLGFGAVGLTLQRVSCCPGSRPEQKRVTGVERVARSGSRPEQKRVTGVERSGHSHSATPEAGITPTTRSGLPQLLFESRELVLKLPLLLIAQGLLLLAVLELLLSVLDRLLEILGTQRLLPLHVDLVPGTVEDLIGLPLVVDLGVSVLPALRSQ